MSKFNSLLARFRNDESGATAIEYSLIASLIAIACATAAGAVGAKISGAFQTIAGQLPG